MPDCSRNEYRRCRVARDSDLVRTLTVAARRSVPDTVPVRRAGFAEANRFASLATVAVFPGCTGVAAAEVSDRHGRVAVAGNTRLAAAAARSASRLVDLHRTDEQAGR
jgi:hypothetical protein